jgi:hypothetical protein
MRSHHSDLQPARTLTAESGGVLLPAQLEKWRRRFGPARTELSYRKYSEMRLANLSGAGEAIKELKLA